MVNNNFIDISSDSLSQIFNFIIFNLGAFHLFGRLLIAWYTKQTQFRVKEVLEKLDWDSLYHFHNHDFEVVRDQYHGFILFAVRHRVDQAMCYDSVRNLFLMHNVQHHMHVLSSLSGNHLPSTFSFLFFKAIYRTTQISSTANEMFELCSRTDLKGRLLEIMKLLEDIYCSISEMDYLLPIKKFCPNARNTDHIYQFEGHPLEEELWYSLCDKTVEENYRDELEPYGKSLKMFHLWDTQCPNCKLQLIVFKILLTVIRN